MNKENYDFDKIESITQLDKSLVEYGIIRGNNIIVFIKSGLKGTYYGYENKAKKCYDMGKKIDNIIFSYNEFNYLTSKFIHNKIIEESTTKETLIFNANERNKNKVVVFLKKVAKNCKSMIKDFLSWIYKNFF